MSSIVSAGPALQSVSPLSRLQIELASEVSAGLVSADDQAALGSALKDIDTALKSQAPSSGARPSPEAIKSKIDSLIAGEVADGKLTSAQADELKNVFAKAFDGSGGAGGAGGPGKAGGGAGAPGGGGESSDDPADTNGDGVVSAAEQAAYDAKFPAKAAAHSSATTPSDSSGDSAKLLSDFLKLVQDSLGKSSTYAADGHSLPSQAQSQIVDYRA